MNTESAKQLIRCPRCHRNLDPISFYRDRSKSSGRKSHCRACSKNACKNWKQANPDKVAGYAKEQRLLRRELRLVKRALQEISAAECEEFDRRQLIALFGPDYKQQGIHLMPRRSLRHPDNSSTEIDELREVIELLPEEMRQQAGGASEMLNAGLYIRLMHGLFPMS